MDLTVPEDRRMVRRLTKDNFRAGLGAYGFLTYDKYIQYVASSTRSSLPSSPSSSIS